MLPYADGVSLQGYFLDVVETQARHARSKKKDTKVFAISAALSCRDRAQLSGWRWTRCCSSGRARKRSAWTFSPGRIRSSCALARGRSLGEPCHRAECAVALLAARGSSGRRALRVPSALRTLKHQPKRREHLEALPKRSRSLRTPLETPSSQCFAACLRRTGS